MLRSSTSSLKVMKYNSGRWSAADLEDREIIIHGTGHLVPRDDLSHISTFQLMGGTLVFHAFEVV
jgi:hypothetical protein